jgi:3-hydroxybutyryl-CoA dehydrogenase
MQKIIGVCGAGTMGFGIAQVFAVNGFKTLLFDVNEQALISAEKMISKNMDHLVSKNILTGQQADLAKNNLTFIHDITDCKADIVIEAIVEDAAIKINLYNRLEEVISSNAIIASNTSSLSINEIQAGLKYPVRFAGMHFFNPAPVMKLVEVIKGKLTTENILQEIIGLCKQVGKTPVICNDSPGFIVNRVARHYYLEAMYILEHEGVDIKDIDQVMKATGFKMGPFELMDLIGMDINLSVSESIYKAFNKPRRFEPSATQVDKVKRGELGRKSGKGFYDYNN